MYGLPPVHTVLIFFLVFTLPLQAAATDAALAMQWDYGNVKAAYRQGLALVDAGELQQVPIQSRSSIRLQEGFHERLGLGLARPPLN